MILQGDHQGGDNKNMIGMNVQRLVCSRARHIVRWWLGVWLYHEVWLELDAGLRRFEVMK